MKIEAQNLLEQALSDNINLFLGSGFSVLAVDRNGQQLPIGNKLTEELKDYFNKSGNYTLPQLAQILISTNANEFNKFLINRFKVARFPDIYYNILRLKINKIFTTNIDDLIYAIFNKSEELYLNDIFQSGPAFREKSNIEYIALHGSIMHPERPFIFDPLSIASAFSDAPVLWQDLSKSVYECPTIFIGYSMTDSGILQSLATIRSISGPAKEKWIVLKNPEPSQIDYFSSLGFFIVDSDTKELLEYFESISPTRQPSRPKNHFEDIRKSFQRDVIPLPTSQMHVRPIREFFLGNSPIWSDIFSGQIIQTSHFNKAKDKLLSNKHLIILGIPASGKTTLLMQLSSNFSTPGIKLFFNDLSKSKAELLLKKIGGQVAYLFVDNFTDSVESIVYLSGYSNIHLICADRMHNFDIISHLIDDNIFTIYNVTHLNDSDIQSIYNSLPEGLRKQQLVSKQDDVYSSISLFEFVNSNLNFPRLEERFKEVLIEIEDNDPKLAEFLVLCCYIHVARTPLSFEMVLSYFSEDIMNYNEIFSMRMSLGELIKDYTGSMLISDDQDYYYPRSVFLAEAIIKQVRSSLLAKVMNKFIKNIPSFRVCSFNTFRKKAFDKNIVSRAFSKWEEGKSFFEKVYNYDFENPYVLQQGALYLSSKNRYIEAFHWIDRALNMTDDRYFSIRNSHAIILFDANIGLDALDEVRSELDKSMSILEKCHKDDKRKTFHALRYGDQAIKYHYRYSDEFAEKYLTTALSWLQEESSKKPWDNEVKRLIKTITNIIE